MNLDKIKTFFKSKENSILFFLSLALTANSAVFVFLRMQTLTYAQLKSYSAIVFFVYFVLSAFVLGTIFFFSKKFSFREIIMKVAWVYFPTEVLLFGIKSVLCFVDDKFCLFMNNILPITRVVYLILLGYLVVAYRKAPSLTVSERFGTWVKKQGWLVFGVVLLVFVLNLGFGSYHLTQKAAVDEALWTFDRIPKFWNNVFDGEWQKTQISDKPGITVALTSGVGLFWVNPKEYKNMSWQPDTVGSKDNIQYMNLALRFPILLLSSLMLFVFYFFIEKLLGKTTATVSIIFIGLSPILLGISTIINPDALLWIFLPLSILSYFVYKKEGVNAYLYWAGIFLGLSLLTKYVANILYVFFFLLIFSEYIFNKEKYASSITAYLKKSLLDYFVLIFFSLLTFLVLLPETWVDISKVLQDTIFSQAFQKVWPLFLIVLALIIADTKFNKGRIFSLSMNFLSQYKKVLATAIFSVFLFSILITLANTYFGMKWFDFESILASPKSSYLGTATVSLFLANFFSLIFGVLPLSLLAIVFLAARNIRRKINFNLEEQVAAYLILFILLYYLASAINNVSATVRYQIVIYPLALILAAIGIKQFISLEKIKKYVPSYLVFGILLLFSVYSLNSIKPFYLSYASDLLPQKYVLNLKDMGDGSYEAAQYLNNLPNAKNLLIWTDKRGVCTFFVGNCSDGLDSVKDGNESGLKIDYFVVSSGRESRTTKMTLNRVGGGNNQIFRLDKLYTMEGNDLEWKLKIGGRPNNFVKIIKAEKINP